MSAELVASWITTAGLPAGILRNKLGFLCGYVGIGRDHPWYRKRYSECTLPSAQARGMKPEDTQPSKYGFPPLPERYLRDLATKLVCGEESWCDHRPESSIDVHGGITYSGYGYDPLPRDGEWWFGFDCAHSGDLVPNMPFHISRDDEEYRDETYVRAECEKMAEQLARLPGLRREAHEAE